jgi:hypothetical protein
MKNLSRAIQEFDQVRVFDNSRYDAGPDLVLEVIDGRIHYGGGRRARLAS